VVHKPCLVEMGTLLNQRQVAVQLWTFVVSGAAQTPRKSVPSSLRLKSIGGSITALLDIFGHMMAVLIVNTKISQVFVLVV
jgi:hypothetical protein